MSWDKSKIKFMGNNNNCEYRIRQRNGKFLVFKLETKRVWAGLIFPLPKLKQVESICYVNPNTPAHFAILDDAIKFIKERKKPDVVYNDKGIILSDAKIIFNGVPFSYQNMFGDKSDASDTSLRIAKYIAYTIQQQNHHLITLVRSDTISPSLLLENITLMKTIIDSCMVKVDKLKKDLVNEQL